VLFDIRWVDKSGQAEVWVYGVLTALNNISVILWRSVLLVEETRVPGENHLPAATLSHNVVSPNRDSNSQR